MKNLQKKKSLFAGALAICLLFFASTTVFATVYVTRTGSKYHNRKCGRGTYMASSLESAQARGLDPCAKCFPNGAPASKTSNCSSSQKPKQPSINYSSMTMIVGKTAKLKTKNYSGTVRFRSSDKRIVTVSSSGKLKAKKKGKADITVTMGNTIKKCKVKVENPRISNEKITGYLSDIKGVQITLEGCSHDLEWYSDDWDIVNIDDDGCMQFLSAGVTTVYTEIHDEEFKCVVTVVDDLTVDDDKI